MNRRGTCCPINVLARHIERRSAAWLSKGHAATRVDQHAPRSPAGRTPANARRGPSSRPNQLTRVGGRRRASAPLLSRWLAISRSRRRCSFSARLMSSRRRSTRSEVLPVVALLAATLGLAIVELLPLPRLLFAQFLFEHAAAIAVALLWVSASTRGSWPGDRVRGASAALRGRLRGCGSRVTGMPERRSQESSFLRAQPVAPPGRSVNSRMPCGVVAAKHVRLRRTTAGAQRPAASTAPTRAFRTFTARIDYREPRPREVYTTDCNMADIHIRLTRQAPPRSAHLSHHNRARVPRPVAARDASLNQSCSTCRTRPDASSCGSA